MKRGIIFASVALAAPVVAQAGLFAGPAGGSYAWEASVDLVTCIDADDLQFGLMGRYYFEPVDDSVEPYRLQPFLQAASYAEVFLEVGPGNASLLDTRGRYVFPGKPVGVTATLGFGNPAAGEDLSRLAASAGGVFYLIADNSLAAEVSIGGERWDERRGAGPPPKPLETVERTVFSAGARYVISLPKTGATLEAYGGFRAVDEEAAAERGLVLEARYFFNKEVFAGVEYSGIANRFGVSGGYALKESLELEGEIGTDDELGGTFARFGMRMRF